MIELKNINKEFADGKRRNRVLKDISITFPEKGLYAIYGKSGSGKTTLLNILGGLDKPNSGKITFDGQEYGYISDNVRNKNIGFIFQNYYLERDATIEQVLANQMIIAGIDDEGEIKRRSEIVLDLVNLARFKHKTTNSLSGGQKQRVAIARALIKGANVILADEPTGNLDAENTFLIMDILKEISKTKLVILVTHEQNLIEQYSDAHIELVDGEIKFKSSPKTDYVTGYENNSIIFEQSTAAHTGRLFRVNKKDKKAAQYDTATNINSAGNIFKQIFIISLAIVLAFFSMKIFDYSRVKVERKNITSMQRLLKLSDYSEIIKLERDSYSRVDYFTLNSINGKFTVRDLARLGVVNEKYVKKSSDLLAEKDLKTGKMPGHNEVLLSEGMAKSIRKQLKLKTIKSDSFIKALEFDAKYKVVGLVKGNDKSVYFCQQDYVNTIGLYDNLEIEDRGVIRTNPENPTELQEIRSKVYFGEETQFSKMTTSIQESDSETLADDEVIMEINRSAMYKIRNVVPMETANADLLGGEGKIQIKDSRVFVKQIRLQPTGSGESDVIFRVNKRTMSNLLSQIAPNLEKLKDSNAIDNAYFLISAENKEQMRKLSAALDKAKLQEPNVNEYYEKQEQLQRDGMQTVLLIVFGAMVLQFLIYYFIEKSESIKNRQEYGILRAVGVSRGNLLFKEFINTSKGNFITLSICYFLAVLMIIVRYAILGVTVGQFVLISIGMCLGVMALLTGLSLLPYLFVIQSTPARILARYDI